MSNSDHYKAIIIGSGQGGVPLCQALAKAGWKTAIVERESIGGTCINFGCTPTKTMVASGRVAYLAKRGADFGVRLGKVGIDLQKVRERKRAIVKLFRRGSQKRIENTKNLDLLFGTATFTGPKSIHVHLKNGKQRSLTADYIFINAGARPTVPPLEGLNNVPFLTSTSIMELDKVPEHLLVMGGGYIGLEFGQMFRRFGSRVTIVQSGGQLLNGEDADIAEEVEKILKQDGVKILLNSRAESVSRKGKKINLKVRSGKKLQTLQGSHLLVAVGRTPNTDMLNIVAAGILLDDKKCIKSDSKLATNVDGVYVIGDIKGGPAFTHISYDDFRIVRTNQIENGDASIDGRLLPYTVFIDPQLGRVGLSEKQAQEQKRKIRVAKMPMTYVARALETDESRGFMKAIVDADTNQILGAAVLGVDGGEIMSQIQIAMLGKLPYTVLRDAVFAHPNLSESLNNLFNHFVDE